MQNGFSILVLGKVYINSQLTRTSDDCYIRVTKGKIYKLSVFRCQITSVLFSQLRKATKLEKEENIITTVLYCALNICAASKSIFTSTKAVSKPKENKAKGKWDYQKEEEKLVGLHPNTHISSHIPSTFGHLIL